MPDWIVNPFANVNAGGSRRTSYRTDNNERIKKVIKFQNGHQDF